MQLINLTLEERERWAYAVNDQRTLAIIYVAMPSYPREGKSTLLAHAEVAAKQQELGFPLGV